MWKPLRQFFLLLLALAWGGNLCGAPRRLKVAMGVGNPPYEFLEPSGRAGGFNGDLLRALAEAMDVEIEILALPFGQGLEAFERGEVDAMASVVFSAERAQVMDFTVPTHAISYVFLTRAGVPEVRSEQDLVGKAVLINRRNIVGDYLRSKGVRLLETSSNEDTLQKLTEGEGDCAVVPRFVWLFRLQGQQETGLQAGRWEFYQARRGLVVHKGDTELLARINEGLFKLQERGVLDALRERHFGSLEAAEMPLGRVLRRALPALSASVLGVVLVGMGLWSWSMRRSLRQRTAELEARLAREIQLQEEHQALGVEIEAQNRDLEALFHRLSRGLHPQLQAAELHTRELGDGLAEISEGLVTSQSLPECRARLEVRLGGPLAGAVDHLRLALVRIRVTLDTSLCFLRAQRRPLSCRPLEMELLVTGCVEGLADLCQSTGTRVSVGPLPSCTGDATLIREVFLSLLDNALRHGIGSTRREVEVGGRREGPVSVFWVRDFGPGLTPERLARLWPLDGATPLPPVPGLGLNLVRRIVARHGGHAWMVSETGRGTTVHLSLPA